MSPDRSRHPHPSTTVLVDGRGGDPALALTLAGVAAAVAAGLVADVFVVDPGDQPAPGATRTFLPDAPGAPGSAFAKALAAVVADVVVYVAAGVVPDEAWVDHLLTSLERAHGAAVAAPVRDRATDELRPRAVGLSFVGHPLTAATGTVATEDHRTLFLGDAWAAGREAIDEVGGFDSRLGPAFHLVDLGWRFWLAGAGVQVDPDAVVGAQVAAGAAVGSPRPGHDPVQCEADALSMLYRNLDDASLGAALPAALVLSPLRLQARGSEAAGDAGVQLFLDQLDELRVERHARQALRRRPDAELMAIFRDPLRADCLDPAFVAVHRSLIRALPGGHRFGGSFRIVVATRDALAPRMAGPGIRAWNIASELAREHEVRLVSLTRAELDDPAFSIEQVDTAELADLVEWCDVFVFQGWVLGAHEPAFARDDRIFVVDIYDPMHLEQLEQGKDDGEHNRRRSVSGAVEILNDQLLRGDFFLCASDKQRDFWLGSLASLGRINAAVYDADETLRRQIAVVPFGIPDEEPVRTRAAIKGVLAGVGADDPVILWGGGVYNWFDPLTLIRAVDQLRARIPDVKLVFLGMRHPNAEVPEMRMAVAARELAAELGLVGTTVIFNEQWVAYDDRQNYLLDADVAVTTHLHHVETEFSFRTRVLDYLWAGLPTVATSGDALADLIQREQLGITVPPDDVTSLEAALFRLLDDRDFAEDCRANVALVRPAFAWPVGLRPLVEFCRTPTRSPDLVAGLVDVRGEVVARPPHRPVGVLGRYQRVVMDLVREGDWRTIVASTVRVSRRLVAKVTRRTH